MDLVLSRHRERLQKMIGCSIEFGLMPNISIDNGGCLPDSSLYNINNHYESFYASYLVNLRMMKKGGEKFWITMSPGPDSPIEPWAPFWVQSSKGCDYGGIKKDYSFYIDRYGKKPSGDEDTIVELENKFMDSHVFGFGLNRISKWFTEEKVIQIELFDCAPYAACIIKHSSGKEWSIYADYDFEFWINFSQDLVKGIRETCNLVEIIT